MSDVEAPRRLILGLGNPGERYAGTRHNLGRDVVEEVARRRGWSFDRERCASRVAEGSELILALPETYMNRSGLAARCLLERARLNAERMLVVYDDVALPLGTMRLRPSGGPGGQKGMASVIENLQTREIPRLRLGIGPPSAEPLRGDLSDFVLAEFEPEEREIADRELRRGAEACEAWIERGVNAAMNEFNTTPCAETSDGTP